MTTWRLRRYDMDPTAALIDAGARALYARARVVAGDAGVAAW